MQEREQKLDVETHYDTYAEREWDRLDAGFTQQLEFEGTLDYLTEYLPEDGHVIDVGGGAGRYAIWLAERGYKVTMVDLSSNLIEIAREKAEEFDVSSLITARKDDVRDLNAPDETFDATLCLGGVLSHIIDSQERKQATNELKRVTKPGEPIFISVAGKLAALQLLVSQIGEGPNSVDQSPLLSDIVKDGTYDQALLEKHGCEPVFRNNHFFRVNELETLLQKNGLEVEKTVGLENIAQFGTDLTELDDKKRANIKRAVELLREDPVAADMSNRILSIAFKTSERATTEKP